MIRIHTGRDQHDPADSVLAAVTTSSNGNLVISFPKSGGPPQGIPVRMERPEGADTDFDSSITVDPTSVTLDIYAGSNVRCPYYSNNESIKSLCLYSQIADRETGRRGIIVQIYLDQPKPSMAYVIWHDEADAKYVSGEEPTAHLVRLDSVRPA